MLEVVLHVLEAEKDVRHVLYALEMLEGMRRVLLCMLEAVESELCFAGGAEGDTLCATLYAGGCGGYALFAGGVVRCRR